MLGLAVCLTILFGVSAYAIAVVTEKYPSDELEDLITKAIIILLILTGFSASLVLMLLVAA